MHTSNTEQNTLKDLVGGIVAAADLERSQSEAYKTLFTHVDGLEQLTRELNNIMTDSVLNASKVLKDKLGYDSVPDEAYFMLLALPFLKKSTEKHIRATQGMSCCVDKTYWHLANELRKLLLKEKMDVSEQKFSQERGKEMSTDSIDKKIDELLALVRYEVEYADTHGGCPPAVRGIKRHGVKEAREQMKKLLVEQDEKAHMLGFKNGKWAMTKRVNDLWFQLIIDEVGSEKASAYRDAIAVQLNKSEGERK